MRVERDSMGDVQVPAAAYYGASTQRAVENFPISDLRFGKRFIWALGLIKGSAAEMNKSMGIVDGDKADAIIAAAREVMEGKYDDQFVVDIFQTGSGTSTNMNINEVLSNRASEILGGELGSKLVHPNDHVNTGQSSNDVIPTAMHVAAVAAIEEDLLPALTNLKASLDAKAVEFDDVLKSGLRLCGPDRKRNRAGDRRTPRASGTCPRWHRRRDRDQCSRRIRRRNDRDHEPSLGFRFP